MIQRHDDLQKGKRTQITSVKPEIEKRSCSQDWLLQYLLQTSWPFLEKPLKEWSNQMAYAKKLSFICNQLWYAVTNKPLKRQQQNSEMGSIDFRLPWQHLLIYTFHSSRWKMWKQVIIVWEGEGCVLPEKMGGGVRPASQTLTLLMTKICDISLPFCLTPTSKSCFRPPL